MSAPEGCWALPSTPVESYCCGEVFTSPSLQLQGITQAKVQPTPIRRTVLLHWAPYSGLQLQKMILALQEARLDVGIQGLTNISGDTYWT